MPVGRTERNLSDDEFWPALNADFAAIHNLLDEENRSMSNPSICSGCDMPFDKGKKRKLIDACGHERCYSCMFRSEVCPLCGTSGNSAQSSKNSNNCTTTSSVSAAIHVGEMKKSISSTMLTSNALNRPKLKSNGHFLSLIRSCDSQSNGLCWRDVSPNRLPRPLKSDFHSVTSFSTQNVMTQSCPTPRTKRRFFNSKGSRGSVWSLKGLSQSSSSTVLSDDDSITAKPGNSDEKNCSQNDLYMRLGLLLTDKTEKIGSPIRKGIESAASISSLTTQDTISFPSSNTSPVSTLTGSSETEVQRSKKGQSSDSVSSLMSMSSHSNGSSSPLNRRYSLATSQDSQTTELNSFKSQRFSIRRSVRSGSIRGPVDAKSKLVQYNTHQQLSDSRLPNLKPLFFEVPQQEPDSLFRSRDWLFKEINDLTILVDNPGVLITGLPGTGKTALMLQLVECSCFGRHVSRTYQKPDSQIVNGKDRPSTIGHYSLCNQVNLVPERIKELASKIVAYHFCQAENNSTCMVPDFVHSLAAQLCQSPILFDYKDYLLSESYLLESLSMKECIANPDLAFTRGILEPLQSLQKLECFTTGESLFILVDGLCEAEYHRPDYGDTIASFLAKHTHQFPPWLKIIATVRTHLEKVLPVLPFAKISLDVNSRHLENIEKDLFDYINFRVTNSANIQNNLVTGAAGQYRFCQHLLSLSKGSFLFAKLTLDFFEKGRLVAKSTSFKVLPVTLAQIYQLHFNLKFPTASAFHKVSEILSVTLASLYPLTLNEIYYTVNSLNVHTFVSWKEFVQRFKTLSEFLIKRTDNTYMFFHPTFREWLFKKDEMENNKFTCDLRSGHAAIALRLSRMEAPLDAEKTLELGHHILKAHIYKNMTLHKYSSRDLQSYWIVSVTCNVSAALCSLRNVYTPNVKVSRLLLLSGASPDYVTDCLGHAPALCLFAYEGIDEMVSLMLEFGANVDLTNNQGRTPLIMASIKGREEVARLLIGAGANLGHVDTAGRCALVHAARNGHLNILAYLLNCDWVVSSQEREVELAEATQQALIAAASQGHEDIVKYLLNETTVDVDGQCTLTGETALTVAATNGLHKICSILINQGCKINCTNRKEMSALLLAVKEGHLATTEILIQYQVKVNQCDCRARTPLIIAASEGHIAIIELLLDKGSDISAVDCEGMTALSWACLRGKIQVVRCLLDKGAEINFPNKLGRTPLDLAAFQGNPNLVQLLMDRGAIIEHADLEGVRPLDRAISCRNLSVVQCFLRKGAKLGPATWSMAAGKWDVMLVLLNKLLEDGNVLYRKNKLREAAHRYSYALGKFPSFRDLDTTFRQLRLNFLLNYSRCKRKMREPTDAVNLATEVLNERPNSYEAFYARAKARIDLRSYREAMRDIEEALKVLPCQNRDIRGILLKLKDEINEGILKTSSISTVECPSETSL